MPQLQQRARTSLVAPILLITLGGLFLYATWRPAFDLWPILRTYWPLILIFIGLGKMWDVTRERKNPNAPRTNVSVGSSIGVVVFILVLVGLFWHGRAFSRDRRSSYSHLQHQSRTVDRQNAKSVHASLEAGAGQFNVSGGSSHLLEADFDFSDSYGTPRVDYNVSNGTGELTITQDSENTHFGATHNEWNLRFSNEV